MSLEIHPPLAAGPTIVVPGNFDGVHLGHRALLAQARRLANGAHVVALTFEPHPLRLLLPERAPGVLTAIDRKITLLRAAGADAVAVAKFDRDFSELSPEAFISNVFVDKLHAAHVIVGEDFRFGHKRAGDLEAMRTLGAPRGITVHRIDPVAQDNDVVSSTRIRHALGRGDVAQAARCLGRGHEAEGKVIHGDARGRTIGFPTANLSLPGTVLPSHGVYAVFARDLSRANAPLMRGVANYGVRPTVGAGPSLEVHLFDFDGDLYDHTLRIAFVARLRDEMRFSGLDALVTQIKRDVQAAQEHTHTAPEWTSWL